MNGYTSKLAGTEAGVKEPTPNFSACFGGPFMPREPMAYAAMLAHWLEAPGVRGLLLWVVPTDPDDPASEPAHGFNPLNRPAEQVIRRAFLGEPESAS